MAKVVSGVAVSTMLQGDQTEPKHICPQVKTRSNGAPSVIINDDPLHPRAKRVRLRCLSELQQSSP